MLDNKGFDLWADGYDKSVGLSDEGDEYPFAGYREILGEIYKRILTAQGREVLDIGFGTGTLTTQLYQQGCWIYGQDFSTRMIELAQEKMPRAMLIQGDFSEGIAPELKERKYDAIVATYSLHHLTDAQKVRLMNELLTMLNENGCIYIGDVAFETRKKLDACRMFVGDDWDEDEIYFVFDELKTEFPELEFCRMSSCAGLLTLRK